MGEPTCYGCEQSITSAPFCVVRVGTSPDPETGLGGKPPTDTDWHMACARAMRLLPEQIENDGPVWGRLAGSTKRKEPQP